MKPNLSTVLPLICLAMILIGTRVSAAAGCIPPPPGLVSWWPGDGTAQDIVGTNHGTFVNGTAYATGMVRQAFALDGITNYVSIPHAAALNPTGAFSVEVWIKANPQQFSADHQFLIADKSHGFVAPASGWLLQGGSDGRVGFGFGNGSPDAGVGGFPTVATLSSVLDDQWHHLAGVFTGTELQIFLDSLLQSTLAVSILPTGNNREMEIGRSWGGGAPFRYFHGLIDEVTFFNRALSPSEVAGVFNAGSAGKCRPPMLLSQPQSQLGFWGKSTSFTVNAAGTDPLTYQWQKDGQIIDGATAASLILTNLQMTDAGAYTVMVTNAYGRVTSRPAILTMNPAGVAIALYAGVTIDGVVGLTYGVQYATDLSNTNDWKGLANVTLSVPTQFWLDVQPAAQPRRYYRVVPGPISIP